MANVFERSSENTILKDERFLYQDFVPERLPFRDEEIGELVFCLKPASQGRKPTNVFVSGKPGTGKTVTLKFVLSELEEFSDRAKGVYINCFEYSSRHSILAKLTNFLGYPVPERGLSTEEVFDRFVALLRNKKIIPLIVFDEAEQLLKNDDSKKLLYDLSRMAEQFKLTVGLVFISNDNFFLASVDDRVRSSLQASTISFEPYTHVELKDILNERAKYAFFPNSVDSEIIGLCAAHASKNNGDARIAIDVLLKSARLAEKENSKKVLVGHVRSSFQQEKPVKIELSENLSEQEKAVLEVLEKKGKVESTDLYILLKKRFAERTVRQAVGLLEEKKLVNAERITKGKGSTRLISKR